MTTIGIPGSTRGIQKSDPTLAEVLEDRSATRPSQFGKNHVGDRNDFLPTVHGFDEWFGNLYHLNAEEEPEELDYPGQNNPALRTAAEAEAFTKKWGPRGVLHTWATNVDDSTVDPKFGRVGKQKIENTGPLTRKRMETFDAEVHDRDAQVAGQERQRRQALVRLVQLDRHSHPVAPLAEVPPEGRG